MPQYTKTFLTKEANKFGAEVTVNPDGRSISIIVDAPDGKIWRGNGTHALVASCFKGPWGPTEEVVKDLLERMAGGLEDCPDADCDICEEQEEDEDGDGGDGDGEEE